MDTHDAVLAKAILATARTVSVGMAWQDAQRRADTLRRAFDLADEESVRLVDLWRTKRAEKVGQTTMEMPG